MPEPTFLEEHEGQSEYYQRLAAQQMGHRARAQESQAAYHRYKETGDPTEINRLIELGVYINVPL